MKLFRWLIFVLCVLRGIRYNSRNACLTVFGPSVKLEKPNKELQNDPSCAKCFPHVTSQPQHLSVDLYVPTISPTSISHTSGLIGRVYMKKGSCQRPVATSRSPMRFWTVEVETHVSSGLLPRGQGLLRITGSWSHGKWAFVCPALMSKG